MEDFNLHELMFYQVAQTNLQNYESEFLAFVALRESEGCALRRRMSSAWMNSLNRKTVLKFDSHEAMIERSNRFREEGNTMLRSKSKNDRKAVILDVGRRYTQAIIAAPARTEALALAHANRAMILQEFGYYQQAYDDCVCALETSQYPTRLQHKIKTRQAYCMWHLNDAVRLKVHLAELEKSMLNESFMQCLEELREGLSRLQLNAEKSALENAGACAVQSAKDKTRIVTSNDRKRGLYMTAAQPIKTGELVFSEHISAFVPVAGSRMCQQCGVTLLIPFPCHSCHGHVIYCSIKCLQMNAAVHQYECVGYRLELFEQIGVSHLALRVVLEQLPCVVPLLRQHKDAAAIWLELTSSAGVVQSAADINYAQTLRMVTHLAQLPLTDILWFATMAEFLVVFLKEYTNFFDAINNTAAGCIDWELITGALILRHIGQFIVNAHTCVSLAPVCDTTMEPEDSGFLLMHELWSQPLHVRRGYLHKFANYREIAAANLPYLSVCNHACAPTFRPRFSGRYFYALADKDITVGEEIFNCYTLNYKKSLKKIRRSYLKNTYHFDCKCEVCESPRQDAAYEKYHRYKCRNPKCRTTFVPISMEGHPLNWWQAVDENNVPERLPRCTSCGEEQSATWFTKFKELLLYVNDANQRAELFRLCKAMDKSLLDYHSLKLTLRLELVGAIFDFGGGITTLADDELGFIVNILNCCLRGIADQCGSHSIEYVVTMTYIWDLVALKKYQCSRAEMQDMLSAIDIISEEYKIVFSNYYAEFLSN